MRGYVDILYNHTVGLLYRNVVKYMNISSDA